MKKFFPLVMILALLLIFLAACGGASDGGSSGGQPGGGSGTTVPSTGGDTPQPPPVTPGPPGGATPGGGALVEGDLHELIAKIYADYHAKPDVIAAKAENEEINTRLAELSELVYGANDLTDTEKAELATEMEGLSERNRELTKFFIPFTAEMDLTQEGTEFNPNVVYFIGADDIPFREAVVSEAALMAQPYSLVLLRMEEGADIEAAKSKIRSGVNPRKWECVGIDPADVVVDNIGDLVILIMAHNSKQLHESFLTLAV